METLYLVIGAVLLAGTLVDVLWTTLWPDGASGPLSGMLTTLIWRATRWTGRLWERATSLGGPFVLVATLGMWIALLWTAWVFLFASDDGSLTAAPGADVTWAGRIYFVAYSMFTMGNGDYMPAGGAWQLATSLTTATGMVIVTLSVTYILSVVSAVAQKRAFAASVTGLGARAEDLVVAAWNGKDLHSLDLTLDTLSSQLAILADQHKSFPVLHYFHAADRTDASAVAVAMLDEALTIIDAGVEHAMFNRVTFRSARSSVDNYLGTMRSSYLRPADEPPPLPDLSVVRAAGIPTVDDREFADRVRSLEERRRALLGVVHGDAWEWRP
jgi:hypothetical protein